MLKAFAHLDEFLRLLVQVVPEAVVDPEAQQLQRWLRAEQVVGRHVEVVQKEQESLPAGRHKHAFGPLLDAALDDGLDVVGGGLGGGGDAERRGNMNSCLDCSSSKLKLHGDTRSRSSSTNL